MCSNAVPVQANVTLSDTKFPIGSNVKIPCHIDGNPAPKVEWYKDGQPIVTSSNVRITGED